MGSISSLLKSRVYKMVCILLIVVIVSRSLHLLLLMMECLSMDRSSKNDLSCNKVKSSFYTCLTEGIFHGVLFLTEDELSTALDQIQNHASLLEVLHVILTTALVEAQSILNEVVYFIDWLMFPHFLLEFLSCFAELLFFFFSLAILIEFKVLNDFCIFLLHFQQEIAQKIEERHVFLHSVLSFIILRLEDLKQTSNFFSVFYPFGSEVIDHQYRLYFWAEAFHILEISSNNIVVFVHIEV